MQIKPSNSLLQALSTQANSASPAARPRPQQTDAARAAARAVFAQLNTPAAGSTAAATRAAPPATSTSPAIPSTQPRRPLPRGSIINILV